MQSPNNRRRFIFIIGLALLAILALTFLLLAHSSKPPKKQSSSYVDPLSHETISNPAGVSPEIYGSNKNTPLYLGFDKLLNYGLTFDQVSSLEAAFYNYTKAQTPALKQVSVAVDTITPQHDPNDPNSPFLLLFNVGFGGKTIYKASVNYSNLDLQSVQLTLMASTGRKVIYASGLINSSTQPN